MAQPSMHGDLAGQPWSAAMDWELGPSTLGVRGGPGEAGQGPGESMAKLPQGQMDTMGLCPTWDSMTLVTCSLCHAHIKMEVNTLTLPSESVFTIFAHTY